MNKLLNQNRQDLKKSLEEIKQPNTELEKDERNSTNTKNENDRLNMIVSVIDRIYQFFKYKFLPNKQPNKLKLPKWVKVSNERINEMLSTITKAKNDWLKTNVDERETTLDNAESSLKGIANGKINGGEFKREYSNVVNDIEAIIQKSTLTKNQEKIIKFYHTWAKFQSQSIKKNEWTTRHYRHAWIRKGKTCWTGKKAKRARIKNTYTTSNAY